VPTPGQQSLFDDESFRAPPAPARTLNPAGKLFDTSPYEKPTTAKRPSQAEHVASVTGGEQMSRVGQDPAQHHRVEQLKAFMTPKEIHAKWQGLDADRQDTENWEGGTWEGTYTPKSWATGKTQPEDSSNIGSHTYEKAERRYRGIHSGAGGSDTGTIRRTRGGGKYRLHDRGSGESGQEDMDEMWERKLQETKQFPPGGQHEEYGSPDPHKAAHSEGNTMGTYEGEATVRPGEHMPRSSAWNRHYAREQSHEDRRMEQDDAKQARRGDSMYDSIAEKGVLGPIRLGRQLGEEGKPQIVGGHHRLAAATDIDPDRLVPVLHDESIWDAQHPPKRGYPYA
jgi:hypothetical protein